MLEIAFTGVVVLAITLIALLVFATTRPDTFTVRRSIGIAAPAERPGRRSAPEP